MSSTLSRRELRGGDLIGRHPPAELAGDQPSSIAALAADVGWPVTHECDASYRAIRTSGYRKVSSILWLVVHDEEAWTAAAAASWFTNPDCRGSAHLCVDGRRCYRTLSPSVVPWGAPGANLLGWHMELAGFAAWTRAQWLELARATIERAAFKLAWHHRAFKRAGAPVGRSQLTRFLTVPEIRAKRPGLVTHADVAIAFPTGDPHHDPGTGFPRDVLVERVQHWRRELAAGV